MLKKLEQKFIFPLAKTVSILAIIGIMLYLFVLLKPQSTKSINYNQIKSKYISHNNVSDSYKASENLKNIILEMGGDLEQFESFIGSNIRLIPENNRSHFESNFADFLKEVVKDDSMISNRMNMINDYVELQIAQYNKKSDSIETFMKTIGVLLLFLIFVLLVNLMAILSIEKNTRKL